MSKTEVGSSTLILASEALELAAAVQKEENEANAREWVGVWYKIRKAASNGERSVAINPMDFENGGVTLPGANEFTRCMHYYGYTVQFRYSGGQVVEYYCGVRRCYYDWCIVSW